MSVKALITFESALEIPDPILFKKVFLINSEYFWECKKWDRLPPHKITNPASSKSSLGCLFRWQAPIRCQTALFCYKTHLLAGISRIFTQEHGGGNHNYKSHYKLIEDKPLQLKVNLGSLFTFLISIRSLYEIYVLKAVIYQQ